MSLLNPTAVSNVLKTASYRLREQEAELAELREKLAAYESSYAASEVVDSLIARGIIDQDDRGAKIAEFASDPDQLPVIQKAAELASNNFKLAGILNSDPSGNNSRNSFEAFLLSN
jgi:hypothetical protein